MRRLSVVLGFLLLCSAAWGTACPTGYTFSDTLTVDHTKVTGGADLSNFPVYFAGNAVLKTASNGGQLQLSTGVDVVFCDAASSGNLLDYELVSGTYSASAGTGEWHIGVPTLSHTADTVIYIFTGNASGTDHSNPTHLCTAANYISIYHFGGSTLLLTDSCGNNNLTTQGSTGVSHSTGQIQGAVATGFQAVANNTSATGLPTGTSARTTTVWFQQGSPGANANAEIACYGANSTSGDRWGFWWFNTGNTQDLGIEVQGSGSAFDFTQDTSWHYLTASNNSSNSNTSTFTLDGASQTKTRNDSQTINTSGTVIEVGGVCGAGTLDVFSGNVDEYRINSTVLTTGWIGTEYNNQFSPSTFYAFVGTVPTHRRRGWVINN